MKLKRAVIIVIDGLGVGALPDAASYGDTGSHTLDNTAKALGKLHLPNFAALGLGCIEGVTEIQKAASPQGSYGRMAEASPGKDSITGHWEMAGLILDKPFPTFPDGFPAKMLHEFTEVTGKGWLWGKTASGTEIINRLGPEHLATGRLIVYTSADSVFQIAAHEDAISITELYEVCKKTRAFLDNYNVQRVIARPFTGKAGAFTRTYERRDFSILPPEVTLLERFVNAGISVTGIGKIGDIFAHRGLSKEVHTEGDMDGLEMTMDAVKNAGADVSPTLVFTNLVDFDMRYGHRRDAAGCARALKAIDARLAELMALLGPEDILIITGDHGCDPTTPSTDHSREYVPLLVYGPSLKCGVDLGTRKTFADLGATLCDAFGLRRGGAGTSFLLSLTG
ncbi:MAG: phosphopentomutase [Thermodesulfobacteriota bacterium]